MSSQYEGRDSGWKGSRGLEVQSVRGRTDTDPVRFSGDAGLRMSTDAGMERDAEYTRVRKKRGSRMDILMNVEIFLGVVAIYLNDLDVIAVKDCIKFDELNERERSPYQEALRSCSKNGIRVKFKKIPHIEKFTAEITWPDIYTVILDSS